MNSQNDMKWRQIYSAVLIFLFLQIVFYYFITAYYA